MARYMMAFKGGRKPESEAEGQEMMTEWTAWMAKLGSSLVDPGNPVGKSRSVTADSVREDGGAQPLAGYSIVEADDLDKAVEMAASCPFRKMGEIEVAEIINMEF